MSPVRRPSSLTAKTVVSSCFSHWRHPPISAHGLPGTSEDGDLVPVKATVVAILAYRVEHTASWRTQNSTLTSARAIPYACRDRVVRLGTLTWQKEEYVTVQCSACLIMTGYLSNAEVLCCFGENRATLLPHTHLLPTYIRSVLHRRPSHDHTLPSSTLTHLPSTTASQPSITPKMRHPALLAAHTTPLLSPSTARSSR